MYVKTRVHLSEGQLSKLRLAAKKNTSVHVDIDPKLVSNFDLYLTSRQVNKFNKGKPFRLTLSGSQLSRNGGFIFSIPALIAGIASLAGAASGIAKAVNEKKHQNAVEEEMKRHNTSVENLLKAKDATTSGSGAFLMKREFRSGASIKRPKSLHSQSKSATGRGRRKSNGVKNSKKN